MNVSSLLDSCGIWGCKKSTDLQSNTWNKSIFSCPLNIFLSILSLKSFFFSILGKKLLKYINYTAIAIINIIAFNN